MQKLVDLVDRGLPWRPFQFLMLLPPPACWLWSRHVMHDPNLTRVSLGIAIGTGLLALWTFGYLNRLNNRQGYVVLHIWAQLLWLVAATIGLSAMMLVLGAITGRSTTTLLVQMMLWLAAINGPVFVICGESLNDWPLRLQRRLGKLRRLSKPFFAKLILGGPGSQPRPLSDSTIVPNSKPQTAV